MPLVNPLTIMGEVVPVPVKLPGLDVTVYPVIALPPVFTGAINATLACAFPAVATTLVGASGTVAGVTATDAVDATDEPAALVATTAKV